MDFVGRRGRFPIRMAKFSGANSLLVSGGWPGWWQLQIFLWIFFMPESLGKMIPKVRVETLDLVVEFYGFFRDSKILGE